MRQAESAPAFGKVSSWRRLDEVMVDCRDSSGYLEYSPRLSQNCV